MVQDFNHKHYRFTSLLQVQSIDMLFFYRFIVKQKEKNASLSRREKRQTLEHPNVEISKVLILQNFPTHRVRQVSFHQFAAATIFLVGQTYATNGQETGAFL